MTQAFVVLVLHISSADDSLVLITKRLSVLGKPPEIHRRDSCVSLLTQPKISIVKELVAVLIGQYAMV